MSSTTKEFNCYRIDCQYTPNNFTPRQISLPWRRLLTSFVNGGGARVKWFPWKRPSINRTKHPSVQKSSQRIQDLTSAIRPYSLWIQKTELKKHPILENFSNWCDKMNTSLCAYRSNLINAQLIRTILLIQHALWLNTKVNQPSRKKTTHEWHENQKKIFYRCRTWKARSPSPTHPPTSLFLRKPEGILTIVTNVTIVNSQFKKIRSYSSLVCYSARFNTGKNGNFTTCTKVLSNRISTQELTPVYFGDGRLGSEGVPLVYDNCQSCLVNLTVHSLCDCVFFLV